MYTKENKTQNGKDKKLINIEDENHKTKTTEDSNSDLNTYLPDDERKSLRNRKAPEYYGEWANAVNKSTPEPITLKEALSSKKNEKWRDAMKDEINSLKRNNVWDLIQLPEGRKAIGCKWLYKIKYNADGNVERYKARLVAQGFNQRYWIDYEETFSPVVRFESVRTVIALATKYGLELHQMDVKAAFLNGELKEDIYMKQPEVFIEKDKDILVCKLRKSIYGLKQSARCWNTELNKQIKKMGFNQSSSDPCIYVRDLGEVFILAICVDDIILAGENTGNIDDVKRRISEKFDVKGDSEYTNWGHMDWTT